MAVNWLMAIANARTRRRGFRASIPIERHYPLGPALGQCCGGAVTLRFFRLDQRTAQAWPAPAPRFFLQLYGAGHVGRAIVQLLSAVPCHVQWIDEREDEFPADTAAAAARGAGLRRAGRGRGGRRAGERLLPGAHASP